MEEEKKVPNTSEPNPNGGEQVKTTDLEDENSQGQPAPTGEGNQEGEPNQEGEGTTQAKPKQDRKTDAEYARERRERKAREEAEKKAREDEIRRQAVFEVKSSQVTSEELNELDLAKVDDEDQLFLVEELRKAKASGDENPVATAYKELFKKQKADKVAQEEKVKKDQADEERRKAIVAKDQANFKAKFGKTTAEVIKNEPEFVKSDYFKLIYEDKGNFTEVYGLYLESKKNQSTVAKQEGSFPTSSEGAPGANAGEETEEDFKKRWIAEHGHW